MSVFYPCALIIDYTFILPEYLPKALCNRVIFTLLFVVLIRQRVNKPRSLTLNLKEPQKTHFTN